MPSERHAEYEAARGARVLTLRDLARRLCEAAEPDVRETAAESTRLLTQKTLRGRPPALGLALDDALGQLRRAGTRASDLARISGPRSALLATTLEQTDARLSEYRLRDQRANAWHAARALPRLAIPELAGVTRVRVRGLSNWENGDLALLEALHEKLRGRRGRRRARVADGPGLSGRAAAGRSGASRRAPSSSVGPKHSIIQSSRSSTHERELTARR